MRTSVIRPTPIKIIKPTILLSILFSLLIIMPTSLAEGCFYYDNSLEYCQLLSYEDAKAECSNYEDCLMSEHFFEGKQCYNPFEFPGCQKVICKSNCKEIYSGQCLSGVVEKEKYSEWCFSGCCKFYRETEQFCEYTVNKGICEITARNLVATEFSFIKTTENLCEASCSKPFSSSLEFEEVSPANKLTNFVFDEREDVDLTQYQESLYDTNNFARYLNIFYMLILLMIIFLMYHYRKNIESLFSKKNKNNGNNNLN